MNKKEKQLFEFGPFRLDTAEHLLWRDGEAVPLTPKAFSTLAVLVANRGHLVEKDELMALLWPDTAVEENNLNKYISALRKALDEGDPKHSYIETVPKLGYRFVAPVNELDRDQVTLVVERRTLTRIVTEEEEHTGNGNGGVQSASLVSALALPKGRTVSKRGVAVAGALVLVIGIAAFIYPRWTQLETRRAEANAVARPPLRSVAVLPFKGIGVSSENEYLGLGLADALITRLGNVQQITVRPTSAVRRYTDANQDPLTIGRQQGVDAVLDGSVQRVGDRLRLTVQFVRVADGMTLWSEQVDEKFTDIFSVQDSISERVACDLVTHICGASGSPVKRRQINIDAYEAYLKGRYFWNKRTREGFQKAVEYFNQAIEIDPNYAQAYAGLGDALAFLGGDDRASQTETDRKARAATLKALELDDSLADAHASLGVRSYDSDFPEAERRLRRAIELNPNHATAHQWLGEFLAYMGRFDEAITEIERAHEIDPLSLIISTDVAKVYAIARQYDRAIEQFKKTLEMEPTFDEAHALLGLTYVFAGRAEEAISELRRIKDLEDKPGYLSWLGYAYGVAGKKREAQGVRQRLGELSTRTFVTPFAMTYVDMGLGEKERVFAELEQMFKGQPWGKVSLKVNPVYDSLRSDPRYDNLLKRAGFTL